MYSQSIPLVEKERGGPARDLDAQFDPRIGRPMKPSVRSPRPSGLKDDHTPLPGFLLRFSSVSAPRLRGSPTVTQQGTWW